MTKQKRNGRVMWRRPDQDACPAFGAWDALFVAAVTALAAALRWYRIDSGLWYDEIVTLVQSVRLPLQEIVTQFPGENRHPLYAVLAHAAVAIFDESPWTLRLPAALFGILAVPLLYVVGRALTDRREAGAAVVILAVSYHHVWFSQNARGYTAMLFFALLSTLALHGWLRRGRPGSAAAFAVATALGAYAHLTMALLAVGQAVACLAGLSLDRRGPQAIWRTLAWPFGGAAALTLLLYAPMLGDVGATMTREASPSRAAQATMGWAVSAALQGLQVGFGTVWAVVAGFVVLLAGAVSYLRRERQVALLLTLPVLVAAVAPLLLGRPLRPRFLFFAAGFALLVGVRGAAAIGAWLAPRVARLTPRAGAAAAVALFTAAAVVVSLRALPYGYRYAKQDYEQAVALVERASEPGDLVAVVADGGAIPIVQYLGRPWTRIDSRDELGELRGRARTVWVVHTFASAIEAGRPELWELLQQCPALHDVASTVEDGTITVRRCR